jgi:putative chitinase
MSRAIELSKKYKSILDKGGINTPKRLACFFATIATEVGEQMIPKEEGSYYSTIKALRSTFHSPFKGQSDAFVSTFLRLDKKDRCLLFNYVYSNRGGNGDINSGDGCRYIGRGFFQHTFFNNYRSLSNATGIDYVKTPELLNNEADAMIGAIWYWNTNRLSVYADSWKLDAIRDLVNIGRKTTTVGDANGYKGFVSHANNFIKIFDK